jgi:peptide/nickel transport system ATP-binding protein
MPYVVQPAEEFPYIYTTMIEPLLSVQGLTVNFASGGKRVWAVSGASFQLQKGEILAIVGESGSGKSVTALSLMKLLPRQAHIHGRLLFSSREGRTIDLNAIPEAEISAIRGKEIAMIFQEPMTSLNPVFTCGYQVMESIRLHQQLPAAEAKEKAIALFEKVQLPFPAEMIGRYPHELSGGQKQRVMIAMAISCGPGLLIADEPTTALDVTVQKAILDLLRQLQRESGMGVIFITHDLGLVADLAHKVAVMYRGSIVEVGSTEQVLEYPVHPYTQALLACRPGLHSRGDRLPVVGDFMGVGNMDSSSRPGKASDIKLAGPVKSLGSPDADTVLKVENLEVQFHGRRGFLAKTPPPFKAVDGVSFEVRKGETVGLVGESGCGKTTLARAILQLVPVSAGNILLNGNNLAKLPSGKMQAIRQDLQIVFQDPYGSLNPRLTIGAAILEPMKVHGILRTNSQRNDKVVELLEKVNLKAEHFNRYPHEFSGGQRQRICIARALALNPSFLVFDESVSALDVSVQAQVLNLLNDLKKEFGFTSIFISHDLSVVRFISDRILVMYKGKIIEEGPADQVCYFPRQDYTRKLIESIPGKRINLPGW